MSVFLQRGSIRALVIISEARSEKLPGASEIAAANEFGALASRQIAGKPYLWPIPVPLAYTFWLIASDRQQRISCAGEDCSSLCSSSTRFGGFFFVRDAEAGLCALRCRKMAYSYQCTAA